MEKNFYWAVVQKIWGFKGNKYISRLIGDISGKDFFALNINNMKEKFLFLPLDLIHIFFTEKCKMDLTEEYTKYEKLNIKIISLKDDNYPKRLRNIYDPPPLLYVRGNLVDKNLAIAVVGARKASKYGKMVAEEISSKLSSQDIQIISGLARGIDACAHKGALSKIGGTVAILGCGVDIIYPRENKNLYKEILESENSALISELPLGTNPLKHFFPMRNRIISGLSDGVVVIEAGEKSGSLITAELGLEQGKDVFAVPGPITSPLQKGCHKLIKDGAKLTESVNDILEEYGQLSFFDNKMKQKENLGENEKKIWEILSAVPTSIDQIAMESGLSTASVISILTLFEIKGRVEKNAGRKYYKIK